MSAAEVEVGEEPDEDVQVEEDFSSYNKAELQELADERGVEYLSSDTKPVLISRLDGSYVEPAKAPVDELLPIIRVGHWVRFAGGEKGVPEHLAGRDGVVTFALVKRAPGGDRLSNGPYEYQDGSEVFLVEARDTREQLSVTRGAFARFDTDQVRLSVA